MQVLSVFRYFLPVLILNYSTLLACSTSEHHSVLSHYNHAQKVFEGKVIKIGGKHQKRFSFEDKATGIRSIFVKFEVTKNYKNTKIKEEVIVGILPGKFIDFTLGEEYLIYANAKTGYDFLVSDKGIAICDKIAMKKQDFLFQIPNKHTGYLVEYSSLGHKWAEGRMENGLAIGAWKYYAKSGELQIKGTYALGEETGTWDYFYHTNDKSYYILNQIINGDYYKKTGTYRVVKLDSLGGKKFKYQLVYMVGQDTLVEYFYYKNRLKSKTIKYQNGLRNGKEEQFNEEGICVSFYQFQDNLLEGGFWELRELRGTKKRSLRVEGSYRADQKYHERHLYYENGILARTKEVLKAGKLL